MQLQLGYRGPLGVCYGTCRTVANGCFRRRRPSSDIFEAVIALSRSIAGRSDLDNLLSGVGGSLRRIVRFDYLGLTLYHAKVNRAGPFSAWTWRSRRELLPACRSEFLWLGMAQSATARNLLGRYREPKEHKPEHRSVAVLIDLHGINTHAGRRHTGPAGSSISSPGHMERPKARPRP